jgi:hypothetical protein
MILFAPGHLNFFHLQPAVAVLVPLAPYSGKQAMA